MFCIFYAFLLFLKGLSQSSVGIERMSDIIGQKLGINCSALMGANIAHEVADEQFCETTIGLLLFCFFNKTQILLSIR